MMLLGISTLLVFAQLGQNVLLTAKPVSVQETPQDTARQTQDMDKIKEEIDKSGITPFPAKHWHNLSSSSGDRGTARAADARLVKAKSRLRRKSGSWTGIPQEALQ